MPLMSHRRLARRLVVNPYACPAYSRPAEPPMKRFRRHDFGRDPPISGGWRDARNLCRYSSCGRMRCLDLWNSRSSGPQGALRRSGETRRKPRLQSHASDRFRSGKCRAREAQLRGIGFRVQKLGAFPDIVNNATRAATDRAAEPPNGSEPEPCRDNRKSRAASSGRASRPRHI